MKEQLQDLLIKSLGDLIEKGLLTELPSKIRLDHTKDKTHGDYATNVALVLAKQTNSDPKKLAQTIVDQLGESELVKKTEETAAFHVLRGNSSVVLYCENSKRRMRYHIDEGEINPLNLGSSGKVLEAFVNPKTSQSKIIKDQGYYISHGERDPDIAGITVPILGRDGELIGVISLSGLTTRFTDENIESYLKALISISKKVCLAFGSK